ncbi:unnamed protein product [Rotaria sordida]|uniref:EB domain-containing protein n=1 Tax=Rotaria sordida TaxID=392033 RepID=A0A814RCX3_9BILA|nr:unnamed protein product [Rotaria sordida]CAF1130712.1 unnamed protein product [Rotaria sordida]CAF1283257.1 unnamed protein product [Rotaria sordida]CAF1420748.1 unnamed protein product [Rotaria sordida]CAF1424712.1 unnamed protein product [Rotaria sordida]
MIISCKDFNMWFILLLIIATATAIPVDPIPDNTPIPMPPTPTTKRIHYDSVLGYRCESNSNCNGFVNNARCLNGTCACQPGHIAKGIWSCVQVKKKYHH